MLLIYTHSYCGSARKKSTCNMWDLGSIPGLGRSPGEGKGYPLQCSGLENSMDCIVHGVAKSQTWLSDFHFTLGDSRHHMHVCTHVCVHIHAHCTHTLHTHTHTMVQNHSTKWPQARKLGFSQGYRAVTVSLQSGICLHICSTYLIKPALSKENKYFKSFHLPFFCSQSEFSLQL